MIELVKYLKRKCCNNRNDTGRGATV